MMLTIICVCNALFLDIIIVGIAYVIGCDALQLYKIAILGFILCFCGTVIPIGLCQMSREYYEPE